MCSKDSLSCCRPFEGVLHLECGSQVSPCRDPHPPLPVLQSLFFCSRGGSMFRPTLTRFLFAESLKLNPGAGHGIGIRAVDPVPVPYGIA